MKDLAAIVKNVANDMVEAGEKAGKAFMEHLRGVGQGIKDSAETYRRTEDDIKNDIGKIGRDGESDLSRDAGSAGRDAGGGASGMGKDAEGAGGARPGGGDHPVDPEAADGNVSGEHGSGGDPVDVVSGQMYLPQRDLDLPGVLPLVLERRFSSGYVHGSCFGPRWSSSLDQRVQVDEDGIRFATADGRILHYPLPGEPGEEVFSSFGPRWPLAWDCDTDRDEIRISQGESGLVLTFFPAQGKVPDGRYSLASVTDRGGNRYDFAYDDAGTPTGIAHSGGYRVRLGSRATMGGTRITSVRLADPDDGEDLPVREFSYDLSGNLTGVCDPDSDRPLTFEYDGDSRITSWTDRNGHWYRYEYRADGRVVAGYGEGGYLDATFDYDLDARVTTVTDALGNAKAHHWNAFGQVEKLIDPLGGECFTEQDQFGHVLSNTDQLGRRTAVERNEAGDPVRVTGPDGAATVLEYDGRRLPVRVAQSDGRSWDYEHGPHGQVTAIRDPLGGVARFGYDAHGREISATGPLGASTSYRCNPAGQPVEAADALGAVTTLTRDVFGRITGLTDAVGATTANEWSAGGRLLAITYPDGTAERWEYDAEGNVTRIESPTGAATEFTYGPFDTLTSRTDPDGSTYQFAYDAMLRLVTVTGPTGLTWSYEYDSCGRLTAETDFDGIRVEYELDPAGQLAARTTPAGTVSFTRDLAGRPVERDADGRVTRFSYGIAGQLERAENPDAVIEYSYDGRGQAVSETVNGRVMTSSYDLAGRRVQRITPSGVTSTWAYDLIGQHTGLTGTGGALAFSYDQAGQETGRRLGPGASLRRVHDTAGQLISEAIWKHPAQDPSAPGVGQDQVRIQSRTFSYLPDGTPAEIRDELRGTRRFETDTAGRVTGVQAGSWQAAYAYDAMGNLAGSSDPAAPEDTAGDRETRGTKIQRAGRNTYEYDQAGRLARRVRRTLSGQVHVWHYTWDAENQLASVQMPDNTTWRYAYDPLGRRISKTHHGPDGAVLGSTRFDWDGPRVAEETASGTGGTVAARTWDYEPDGFTPVAQTRRSWAADAAQERIDTEFHAIVTDLVGTPSELITPEGDVAWHASASIWGTVTAAPGSTADCPLRFPGQYHDDETGFSYNLHRYYDPGLGAYLSPDPLGLAPSSNNSAYVANPLVESDPYGLFGCPEAAQKELAQRRKAAGVKSVKEEIDTQAKPGNTFGKMEFDNDRDPIYGRSGYNVERKDAYPGKGNNLMPQSYASHAEADMAEKAKAAGYSGGNAVVHADRPTCSFCKSSMRGYAKMLNLDTIKAYGPFGHIGTWDQNGLVEKGPAWKMKL